MEPLTIRTSAELIDALSAARGGETISLAPGVYSNVVLKRLSFATPVTVQGAQGAARAILRDLMVRDSAGLRFADLTFELLPSAPMFSFQVLGSRDVALTRLDVHGSLNGDPRDDRSAVMIRNSSNVSVSKSRFHQLWHALSFLDSDRLTFTDNSFYELRTDGIRGGGASDVTIERNSFTDFRPVERDHPDAIQFWTTRTTKPARNILIRQNLIWRGGGAIMQGIFLRDEVGTLPYENVRIENNMVAGAMYNGIAASGNGLRVLNNTVIAFLDQKSWIRLSSKKEIDFRNNESSQYLINDKTVKFPKENRVNARALDGGASSICAWIHRNKAELKMERLPCATP